MVLLAFSGQGGVRKLNLPFPPMLTGDVSFVRIAPDGSFAVYVADAEVDERFELYSVPVTGGAPIKLNGPLVAGGDVAVGIADGLYGKTLFAISPDSTRVVYQADQEVDERFELYSVPITGGAATKLNGPLVANGSVLNSEQAFKISSDSARVVYVADQDDFLTYELYSVPITGGASTKLNGPLPPNGNVLHTFLISPDSSRVVYCGDQDIDGVFEIYSVPITGGAPTQLNGLLPAGGDVGVWFLISPDSSRVVYRADQDFNDVVELFSVPIAGGVPTQLNGSLVPGGDVLSALEPLPPFAISPDSSRVVYRADQITNDVFELFSVPITGGVSTRLNGPLVAGGDIVPPAETAVDFDISPDSARVVYRADQDTDEVFELYSVPIGGGGSVKLNGPLVPGGDVSRTFGPLTAFSADSSRVVYVADQDVNELFELYSVSIAGGVPIKLNGPLDPNSYVEAFEISPNSSRVVYRSYLWGNPGILDVFSVPITGGAPIRLNSQLFAGGYILDFRISATGRIVYLGDQDAVDVDELFSVPITGGPPVKLNGPFQPASGVIGDVLQFQVTADASRLVYLADQEQDERGDLYSVPLGSAGTPLKLDAFDADVKDFVLTPDATHAVYRAAIGPSTWELRAVPVAGGTSVQIDPDTEFGTEQSYRVSPDSGRVLHIDASGDLRSTPIGGGSSAVLDSNDTWLAVEISPDSTRVVYAVDRDVQFQDELYSVPIKGGVPVKLNGPLVPGGEVTGSPHTFKPFEISSDSLSVVYRADQAVYQLFELYVVPLGGGPAVKLSAGLRTELFMISPDASRVVYTARTGPEESVRLYSVALAGGTPVELTASLDPELDVHSFRLSPDSSRAVFTCTEVLVVVPLELFSVPIAGGAAVNLSGPLVAGGSVSTYQISPDGARVGFIADSQTDEVYQLHQVPIDGSEPRSTLNGPLVSGGDVASFQFDPSGELVLYRADQDGNNVIEAYLAKTNGGVPRKVNAPLVQGGDVTQVRFAGNQAIYVADQDTNDTLELYARTFLPRLSSAPALR